MQLRKVAIKPRVECVYTLCRGEATKSSHSEIKPKNPTFYTTPGVGCEEGDFGVRLARETAVY
jgi:hypothetical protein